jgi:hypothetical protein
MKILYDEKSNTYTFSDVNDVKHKLIINDYLHNHHESPEVRYITSELLDNMLRIKGAGDIIVNCIRVETIIRGIEKSEEAQKYITEAKNAKEKKCSPKSKRKFGGKGFFSILQFGWNLFSERISKDSYRVVATFGEDETTTRVV